MEKILHQHGDLILKETSVIPRGAKKIKVPRIFVVEKGEGVNTHVITDTEQIKVYEKDDVLYFKTGIEPVKLTHQEHGTQVLEPDKIYKKVIEREFDYESMEARFTQD
jgi:hypothetical protein